MGHRTMHSAEHPGRQGGERGSRRTRAAISRFPAWRLRDCTYRPRIGRRFFHNACGTSSTSRYGPSVTSYTHWHAFVLGDGALATHYYPAARQPYLPSAARLVELAVAQRRLGSSRSLARSAFGSRPCHCRTR